MSKNKIILYAGLLVFAFVLIVLGFVLEKKEPETKPMPQVKDGVVLPDSKDNPLDGDALGTMPSRGSINTDLDTIYKTEEDEEAKERTLQHVGLSYGLKIPAEDMEKMTVEETESRGIISTAFYYEKDGTRAFVFALNNYTQQEWKTISAGLDEIVLGETPVRVLTYTQPSDNPFKEGTEASETYIQLVDAIPSYVESFHFVEEAE